MLSTTISRLSDGLPLAASTDKASALSPEDKNEARQLLKRLCSTPNNPRLQTLDARARQYHVLIANGVVYTVLCERQHPGQAAFAYLEELAREFDLQFGREVDRVERPYACIKFDQFIQKTTKVFGDTRQNRQIDKLRDDLQGVQEIFRSNIEEILNRGERLSTMTEYSKELRKESGMYKKKAAHMNRMALLKMYLPVVIALLIIALVLWWKWRY
eukprot:TRINITY_DN1342_c1_g1_i1.p2 TRINITY_DN1342_c1_g1~~TRINITY_DN1342_c1_g1_i1.p2  ORF type:complete len:215 (+),score=66.58 TRINITY_DN1342_c1_g1_i1:236-880(+)